MRRRDARNRLVTLVCCITLFATQAATQIELSTIQSNEKKMRWGENLVRNGAATTSSQWFGWTQIYSAPPSDGANGTSSITPVKFGSNLNVGTSLSTGGSASASSLLLQPPANDGYSCVITTPGEGCINNTVTMFSGGYNLTNASQYHCAIKQYVDVTPFAKYIRSHDTIVSLSVTAVLGTYNDYASFAVQQLDAQRLPVALSNDVAGISNIEVNNAFTFNASSFSCIQRYSKSKILVQRTTSLVAVTFACFMTDSGKTCDGWGTNFTVALQLEKNGNWTSTTSASRSLTLSTSRHATSQSMSSVLTLTPSLSAATPLPTSTHTVTPSAKSLSIAQRSGTLAETSRLTASTSWHLSTSSSMSSRSSSSSPSVASLLKTLSNSTHWNSSTPTPTRSAPLLRGPSTTAPITAATQAINAGVAAAAALFATSVAGGALMQASLGSAPCANSNAGDSTSDGSSDRSFNPALYLVSPFYGINAYAMVFGNIALAVAACGLHLMIITLKWNNKRSLRTTTSSLLETSSTTPISPSTSPVDHPEQALP